MFNPNPVIQALPIFDGQVCYVIDEALRRPEQWLEQALAHRALFREPAGNAYPGLELPLPEGIERMLLEFVNLHLGRRFHVRRLRSVSCRLAMVGKPPEALQPRPTWPSFLAEPAALSGRRELAVPGRPSGHPDFSACSKKRDPPGRLHRRERRA